MPGYRWIFPKGTGFQPDSVSGLPAQKLSGCVFGFPARKGLVVDRRIRGHIPSVEFPPAVNDGSSGGDAAGFADPTGKVSATLLLPAGLLPWRRYPCFPGLYLRTGRTWGLRAKCYHSFGADLKAALFISRLFQYFPRVLLGMFLTAGNPLQNHCKFYRVTDYRQLYRWLLWHTPGLLRRSI